jgi:two-component system chemotaxis response regulator CheY
MARFLLCDDSAFMRMMLRRILEQAGHEIVGEASNGKEAVQQFRKCKPDLVTMDITMPIMDGIEAVRLIIQQELQARIIMVTAMGQKDIIMSALSAGASDFIVKPFEVRQVVEVVNKQLRHMGQ